MAKSAKRSANTGLSIEADGLVSPLEAARVLMISDVWLRKLVKQGYISPPTGHGRYDLVDCVQGYIRSLKNAGRNKTKASGESRVREARAREIELRIAERLRELVPLDAAFDFSDWLVGFFKAELMALPASITRDLDLRRKLEDHCDGILARGADLAAKRGADLRSGVDPDEADAEDGAGSVGGEQ